MNTLSLLSAGADPNAGRTFFPFLITRRRGWGWRWRWRWPREKPIRPERALAGDALFPLELVRLLIVGLSHPQEFLSLSRRSRLVSLLHVQQIQVSNCFPVSRVEFKNLLHNFDALIYDSAVPRCKFVPQQFGQRLFVLQVLAGLRIIVSAHLLIACGRECPSHVRHPVVGLWFLRVQLDALLEKRYGFFRALTAAHRQRCPILSEPHPFQSRKVIGVHIEYFVEFCAGLFQQTNV